MDWQWEKVKDVLTPMASFYAPNDLETSLVLQRFLRSETIKRHNSTNGLDQHARRLILWMGAFPASVKASLALKPEYYTNPDDPLNEYFPPWKNKPCYGHEWSDRRYSRSPEKGDLSSSTSPR
jgi:hypothetical protein